MAPARGGLAKPANLIAQHEPVAAVSTGGAREEAKPSASGRTGNRVTLIVMIRDDWTFLSNHGHVLVALARNPDARTRDVADAVGITERAVQQIVADLVEHGYLDKEKVGRRNRYRVTRESHFRHELESGVTLGAFVDLVSKSVATS